MGVFVLKYSLSLLIHLAPLKFNLEVPYCDQGHELQERLSLYRSISIFDPVTIPPLEVSVLLTIPPLARYQVLGA